MSLVKTLWGTLFRLFPAPTKVGLRPIGKPDRQSPVLVTCNFDLTVKRLTRELRGVDAWLLVADSKGVNVWCAAGAHELDTRSVVAVVKTSGIAERVDHRDLVLPPLAAPGVRRSDVEEATGWTAHWGPVRARDIPAFLRRGMVRNEAERRVTYDWRERLDTALGSLFPLYLIGAAGFALFGRRRLPDYLAVTAVVFVAFMLACMRLRTRRGITKALVVDALIAAAWLGAELTFGPLPNRARTDLIIALVAMVMCGSELGGLASTLPSDLDPLLARMGIGAVGNTSFAGTLRTDLLNGVRELTLRTDLCESCGECTEVCPVHVWDRRDDGKAVLARLDDCTACTACVLQCQSGAIRAAKAAA